MPEPFQYLALYEVEGTPSEILRGIEEARDAGQIPWSPALDPVFSAYFYEPIGERLVKGWTCQTVPDARANGAMLSLSGVHAGYGELAVLHGLSVYVHRAECVVLLGPNGVGKTTTLRAISGVVATSRARSSWPAGASTAFPPTRSPASASPACRRVGASFPACRSRRT